jgi:signal transduction histidine kinase/CheY-like chemotaxis protein
MHRSRLFSAEPWQVRYLFDLGAQSWMVHICVVSLTAIILAGGASGAEWPYLWLGGMLALSLALVVLCRSCATGKDVGDQALIRAGYAHTALTAAAGLVWGAGAFGAAAGGFNLLAVYSLALGGTALGAVSSQHAVPRSALTSVWTSVPLLGLAHAVATPDASGLPVALMMLLYAAILTMLTIRMHRFLATNHDLTQSLDARVGELTETSAELQTAREEAVDANLAKSRFLAQASHDLRQPIHAIGLLAAALKETRLTREQRLMVSSIERSVDSVTNLFASLLDISRLEIGGIEPRPGSLNLGDFIAGIVEQNKEVAERSGCRLEYVPTAAWVNTDGNLLFTMVQNVLSNAFKYAPGSRVLVGPRRRSGRLALQICDTGPGVEAEQVDAIFREFYRISNDHAQAVEGMGLGLAIVRGLGELLELEVSLSSVPGRGTCVLISGLEPSQPVMDARPRRMNAHPLSGKRICLIDDDETVRAATGQLLERWGCTVMAFTGAEAIEGDFDAIISDLQLGAHGNGLSLVQALRNNARKQIPAIILTGHGGEVLLGQIRQAGIPVLSKPTRPAELRAILTRLCLGLGKNEGSDATLDRGRAGA